MKAGPYQPKGKVTLLIAAMHEQPHRIWSMTEAADAMDVNVRGVMAMVNYALRAEIMYAGLQDGNRVLALRPFMKGGLPPPDRHENAERKAKRGAKREPWQPDPGDVRIPRVVPGWKPPVMVAPRGMA
jgi:hypothetical protein